MLRSRAPSAAGSGKNNKKRLNVAVLGSGGVGKSCLTAQFVQNRWIDSYDPTIEDTYLKDVEVDGVKVSLEVQDTAGTEQFTSMRDSYIFTNDIYLLVFSLTSHSSLDELEPLYHQILGVYEQRITAALPSLSAAVTALASSEGASIPFKSVDYNADRSKPRRKVRGPNPLTSPHPLTEPSTPTTEFPSNTSNQLHSSFPALPPLPLLILANKSDLPRTQQLFTKADIASRISHWHRRYQAQSKTGYPIPAPCVLTTSARNRLNVDEAFHGIAEIGMKFNQWMVKAVPPQPAVPSRNPFSRTSSSNAVPTTTSAEEKFNLISAATSRLPRGVVLGRNRGDTRTSQSTTDSSSRTHRTQNSRGSGSSTPPTVVSTSHSNVVPKPSDAHNPAQSFRKKNIFSRNKEAKLSGESMAAGAAPSPTTKTGSCVVM